MWTFEQTCTNEIEIYRDNIKVASIITDDDCTDDDFNTAQFIVDSCNKNRAI